jgi:GDP-L-fucose synthase
VKTAHPPDEPGTKRWADKQYSPDMRLGLELQVGERCVAVEIHNGKQSVQSEARTMPCKFIFAPGYRFAYAIAKIFATRLCEYINRESRKKSTPSVCYKTLIPCNLFGRYDKFEPEHSHLLPAIIHKVHQAKLTGKTEVDIWGDGTARREFMYAGDLAGAVLHAVQDFEKIPDVINIGLGYDHSINEYYSAAARVIGWQGNFVHDTTKPVGMKQKLVDISRQRRWGWMPSTSLESGVRKTYQYYLEGQKA